MFNPCRPDGSYQLNLSIYEEKQVAKLLCELTKLEGYGNMTDIKIGSTAIEKMSNDIARTLPETGTFECKYTCPEDKIK